MKSYGFDNDEGSYTLNEHDERSLKQFFCIENLSVFQAAQLRTYLLELLTWNKKFNLSAITDIDDIIKYHFQDSLKLKDFIDISKSEGIADIGSGAGFPGLPLKICFPEVPMVLIEVNLKKVEFLEHLIRELKLTGIEVCPLDWRTFLRKTDYQIDLFLTRAALPPEELVRLFQPSCIYNKARLVYWASQQWHVGTKEKPFLQKEIPYVVGSKKRKFVFFEKK